VHVVGFIIRIYHDARSTESQIYVSSLARLVLPEMALNPKGLGSTTFITNSFQYGKF